MKKIVLSLCLIAIYSIAYTQNTYYITGGTQLVSSGGANLVFSSGTITNNGLISYQSPSTVAFAGAVNYGGAGVANVYNLATNSTGGTTVFNSLFSVFNTANLNSGNVNANNKLYVRSDNNTNANVVIEGVVTNNIQGIVPTATITTGSCPSYNSVLFLNVSGSVVNYQWQSSANNSTWSDIGGETNATLSATVTATTYYRCHIITTNSSFDEFTGSVKLNFTGASSTSTTNTSICPNSLPYSWNGLTFNAAGSQTAHLTNAAGCDSAATLNLSVGNTTTSSSTILNCGSYTWNGTTYTTTGTYNKQFTGVGGCDSIATLNLTVVSTLPAITGASSACAGSTTTLTNAVAGGVWFTQATSQATINASTGLVIAKNAGTIAIKYTKAGCGSVTKTFTVNPIPGVPYIVYAPGTANPQIGAPTGGFCVSKVFTVVGTPNVPAGVWSSTGAVSITAGGSVTINSVGTGSIKYTYTSAAGCSNSRTMSGNGYTCAARGISVSGEGLVVSGDFTLYPNPAKGSINLKVETLIGAGSIVVTDLYGKAVKTQALSMGNNTVDIAKLSKGVYFVSTITNEGKTTKKLVVE